MAREPAGLRVAILATAGVERVKLEQPRGAGTFRIDRLLSQSSAGDNDALLPGSTVNPRSAADQRRRGGMPQRVATTGKPIEAICHSP
jgi:hypothetical protein